MGTVVCGDAWQPLETLNAHLPQLPWRPGMRMGMECLECAGVSGGRRDAGGLSMETRLVIRHKSGNEDEEEEYIRRSL